MYDPEQHHRRSIRLPGYDYAQGGGYYVTLCMHGRVCRLGEVVGVEMRLSAVGQMVQSAWEAMPDHYPGVYLDAFVVMPNHLHGIVLLQATVAPAPVTADATPGRTRGSAPTAGEPPLSLSQVLQRFKSLTTKQYGDGVRRIGWPPYRGQLWQRDYFEHIIRNGQEVEHIRHYIAENPARWGADPENPQAAQSGPAPRPWEA